MFDKWRKEFHQGEYRKGQEAVGQEMSTELFEEQQKLLRQAGAAANETLAFADKLAENGDPHRQRLAALIRDSAVGGLESLAAGRHQAGEAREAIEATPFSSNGSNLLETSLPDSPMKALPNESAEPPRRKRGRPPKSPKG